MKKILITLVILFLCFVASRPLWPMLPMYVGVNHLIHLLTLPKDLFNPIAEEACFFWKEGYSATYPLTPKYHDFYELGLSGEGTTLPASYKFQGELLVEFLVRGRVVHSDTVTSTGTRTLADKEMTQCKTISFLDFDLPLKGKYLDDLFLRITVVRPDKELQKYGDKLKFYVAVSPAP